MDIFNDRPSAPAQGELNPADRLVFSAASMKYAVIEAGGIKRIVTGSESLYHYDIIRAYAVKIGARSLEVCGGGMVRLRHPDKSISAYDESASYGQADTETVTKLLTEAMAAEGLSEYELFVSGTTDDADSVRKVPFSV